MSDLVLVKYQYYPFIHNVRKWLNILLKSCGVHTARFLKQIWPFSTFYMKGLNDLAQNHVKVSHKVFTVITA